MIAHLSSIVDSQVGGCLGSWAKHRLAFYGYYPFLINYDIMRDKMIVYYWIEIQILNWWWLGPEEAMQGDFLIEKVLEVFQQLHEEMMFLKAAIIADI